MAFAQPTALQAQPVNSATIRSNQRLTFAVYGRHEWHNLIVNPEIGRILLILGVLLVVIGGLAMLGVRLPFGRLPGDIAIEGERGGIYVPIVTMIIVSIVLTVLFNIFLRRYGQPEFLATNWRRRVPRGSRLRSGTGPACLSPGLRVPWSGGYPE